MTDAEARFSLRQFSQGYGPLIGVMLAIVAAIVCLPLLNEVAAAPATVTDADLGRLRALPAVPGSAESARPAFSSHYRGTRGRGVSPCQRDHGLYGFAQFLHLPQSQLRRLEYSVITDCRLRMG